MGALSDAKAHAVIAVSDFDRAMSFYRDAVGLTASAGAEGVATFALGGGTLLDVYASQYAGTARSTSVHLEVTDLDAAMAELRERGVSFEDYDMGELSTTEGVAAGPGGIRSAWFKDPDGNTIGIVQPG